MRPVLLEMEGFASYRNRTTVDFADTDFFVLVGPTGSGKSTVIDAMIFALYGTVPRWDDRNAVAPALAPTVNRGMVRLIFDVGGQRYVAARDIRRSGTSRGVSVREARLERYASSDATGAVDDVTTSLAMGREVTPAVAELLGLSFDQFTQSVALPQGEFAQFLHATGADRQAILKSLLGYRIYDQIQSAAHSRASNESSRAETLAEQLAGYADATAGAVSEADTALEDLLTFQKHVIEVAVAAVQISAGQAKEARARAAQLDGEREALSGLQIPAHVEGLDAERATRIESVATARAEQSRLQELDATARAAVQRATPRHELERVITDWRSLAEVDKQLPDLERLSAKADSDLKAATAASANADTELDAARASAADTAKVTELRDQELAQVRTHLSAVRSLETPDGIDELGRNLRDATSALTQANSTLAAAEVAQRAAIAALDATADTAALAGTASAADDVRATLVEDLENASQYEHARTRVTEARNRVNALAEALAAAERSLREAEHADQAVALRAELAVGDDCPVCGRVVKSLPDTLDAARLQQAQNLVKTAKVEYEELAAKAAEWDATCTRFATLREERISRCEASRVRLVDGAATLGMADNLGVLATAITFETPTEELEFARAAAESLLAAIRHAQDQRAKAEEQRRAADADVEAARTEVRDAESAGAVVRQEAERARSELGAARDAVSGLTPPAVDDADVEAAWETLTTWACARQEELESHETSVATAADEARGAADEREAALTKAAAAASAASAAVTHAAVTKTEADTRLETAATLRKTLSEGLAEQPRLEDALARLHDVIALQQRVDDVGTELAAARAALDESEKALAENEVAGSASWQELRSLRDPLAQFGAPQLEGTTLTEAWRLTVEWAGAEATARATKIDAEHALAREADGRTATAQDSLIADLAARTIAVAAGLTPDELAAQAPVVVATAVADAKASLIRAQERLATAEQMRTQMAEAQEAGTVARTLSTLMRANNFPQWLIASALDMLLRDASAILLDLSGGQFELRRDGGDLIVIDHNDADMSRPVKTLSGGETFQASLALALALSAQVTALSTSGAKTLESIFLDEGFGTLDEDTLDVVASTLESLASSGSRMVGVITHVGALAERIPARFQVHRDSGGSHIAREVL